MKLRYKILGSLFAVLVLAIIGLGIAISYTGDCPTEYTAKQGTLMNAIVKPCYGTYETLLYTQKEKPEPKANEVLVKVINAAINPMDWHNMRGEPYVMRLSKGLGTPADNRIGADFAGIVESVGASVTRFKPGDKVFGGRSGAFAEYLVVPEDRAIAHMPENVSFAEAASVTIAGVTALQALGKHGELKAGQKVLINGASGGVGTFAVQIAKAMGAEVTGVCSTRNVEMVKSIGADHVFDYKKESYLDSGNQYDLIVDMVGNHDLSDNHKVLKAGGIFVSVGGNKGAWIGPLSRPIKTLFYAPFVDEKFVSMLAQLKQEDLSFLADLMADGKLKPAVGKQYRLEEVPQAMAHLGTRRAQGKLIINVATE